MGRDDGGVLAKALAWLVLLAVLASVALYLFVRTTSPLSANDPHAALTGARGGVDDVRLDPDGRIVVALTVSNGGRLPVTLTGLGVDAARADDPYVATELLLGDGRTPNADLAAPFEEIALEPGQGVGLVVVFTPNPDLRCGRFPEEIGTEIVRTPIDSVALASRTYGVGAEQVLTTSAPFATVGPVTRAECEAVTAP
jgi:hypothetical protein